MKLQNMLPSLNNPGALTPGILGAILGQKGQQGGQQQNQQQQNQQQQNQRQQNQRQQPDQPPQQPQ
jgi:hypothetical protein